MKQNIKRKLTFKEYVYIASMLFGLFFGAGNLIFPISMGQMAGASMWKAIVGFLITGVGLPLLGVAALGVSRSSGLFELSSKVSKNYAMFFTCLLYLTIGPFFAIPRCATTSFTVGIENMIPAAENIKLYLFLFTAAFFIAALAFSLYPGKILTWVGKILNPFFLLFLGILVVSALNDPSANISEVEAVGKYASQPFYTGFLEGYNTMDALASLAFGIVVVQVIKELGVVEPGDVARNTVKSGVFSCILMAVIYCAVTVVGAQSRGAFDVAPNGGVAFAQVAKYYMGNAGLAVLAAAVTLACLKTAVGLITSCAETFSSIFTKGPKYRTWAVIFSAASFCFANLGLNAIIEYAVPVLMFLYPLAIVLIVLALTGKWFANDKAVYCWGIGFTLIGAVYDLLSSLPQALTAALHLTQFIEFAGKLLPLSSLGLGWICPAILGIFIGIVIYLIKSRKKTAD